MLMLRYVHALMKAAAEGGGGSLWKGMSGVLPPPFIWLRISDFGAKAAEVRKVCFCPATGQGYAFSYMNKQLL